MTTSNTRKRTPRTTLRIALLGAVALGVTLGAFSALPGIAHAVNDMRQGKMSAEHREERREQRVQHMLERFDANKDGQITRAEVKAAHEARFASFDADKDGALSQDEFRSMMAARLDEMAKRGFERMDRNKDGKIEPGEQRHSPASMFGRMDANWDGVVTAEELREARFERKHDGLPHHGTFRDGRHMMGPRGDAPGARD
ncbi:MAG: EF-hand domain-containing protein [Oceanibaculum nanhaiense]|uniref:EF-hand domain-containing protein n=1 Tax=Oceanibaculum nanhaiense TaxID=1909734 RepID=UPI0025A33AF3|nr:EF-hand domain-containing protein [Oceanibaculum nanhaiense]MDM7945497.1 EF-hand domain-containing protein [Oceanibaculum nanhaiense]